MLTLPSNRTHNVPDNSNLPLQNVSKLSEEERLWLWLRQRGAGSEGEQHCQAGDQEQGSVHDEEILENRNENIIYNKKSA